MRRSQQEAQRGRGARQGGGANVVSWASVRSRLLHQHSAVALGAFPPSVTCYRQSIKPPPPPPSVIRYRQSRKSLEGPRAPAVKLTTSHHHRRRGVGRIGHHDRCLLTLVLVYSTLRHGVCMVVYVQFSSVEAGTVWGRLIALLTRVRGPLQAAKPCRQSTRWTRDV